MNALPEFLAFPTKCPGMKFGSSVLRAAGSLYQTCSTKNANKNTEMSGLKTTDQNSSLIGILQLCCWYQGLINNTKDRRFKCICWPVSIMVYCPVEY